MASKSDYLQECIKKLSEEEEIDSKQLRDCIETLIKIIKNIEQNPSDVKYKKIRVSNPKFNQTVWRYSPARDFLLASGWTLATDDDEHNSQIIILNHDKYDRICLQVLIDNRFVSPHNHEWTETNKMLVENDNKKREQLLREQAIKQKNEEIEKFNKEKIERKRLAQSIKQEIKSDIEYRKNFTKNQ